MQGRSSGTVQLLTASGAVRLLVRQVKVWGSASPPQLQQGGGRYIAVAIAVPNLHDFAGVDLISRFDVFNHLHTVQLSGEPYTQPASSSANSEGVSLISEVVVELILEQARERAPALLGPWSSPPDHHCKVQTPLQSPPGTAGRHPARLVVYLG